MAASNLLAGGDFFQAQALSVEDHPEPVNGEVLFYFLTFDGLKAYRAEETLLDEDRNALSGLFFLAHKVIAELRKIEQTGR
jgi:hypothetical protein